MNIRLFLHIVCIIQSTITILNAMEKELVRTYVNLSPQDFASNLEMSCRTCRLDEITYSVVDELKDTPPLTHNQNPLYWAVTNGYKKAVKVLIDAIFIMQQRGVGNHNVYDLVRYIFTDSEEKNTLVHLAAQKNNLTIAAILLSLLSRKSACFLITLPNANGILPFTCAKGNVLALFQAYINDTIKDEDLLILIQRLRII